MTDLHEVEAKFEADERAQRALKELGLFGGYRLAGRASATQDDRYYDTVDGLLREAGASLRLRRGGGQVRMTFKGERRAVGEAERHMVSRLEDECDVDAGLVEHLDNTTPLSVQPEPSPLARARKIASGDELIPTAIITTQRDVSWFENDRGARIELALDTCRAVRLNDLREVLFTEVEAELKAGTPDDLVLASSALQREVPGLRPSTRTKLERALE